MRYYDLTGTYGSYYIVQTMARAQHKTTWRQVVAKVWDWLGF